VAVALAAFTVQLPFFDRFFSSMDEGHMLQFADLVANGGEIYRDATIYPLPGAFYFLALLFQVFEPSILMSRWVVVVEFAVFAALVYAWVRKLVPAPYAVAVFVLLICYRIWAFPHWQFYNYSTTAQLVLVTSLLLLLRYFEQRRQVWLLAAGFVFGLGVFCKQDYGAAALLTATTALIVHVRSDPGERFWPLYARFVGCGALVGAAAALHFVREGILGDVIQLTVLNHFVGIASYEYSTFPPLLPLFEQSEAIRNSVGRWSFLPSILITADWDALRYSPLYTDTPLIDIAIKAFFYGPVLLVGAGGLRMWWIRGELGGPRRARYLRELVLWLFAASLMLLVWLNRPQDWAHLSVLYWPLLCLVVVYTHALLAGRKRLAFWLLALGAIPAVVSLGYTARLAYGLRSAHDTRVEAPRAGIYVRASEAQLLEGVMDYVSKHSDPGEAVAVLPYFPIINFLTERPGPHRSAYIVWPFPEIPERDQRVIAALERDQTGVIIYNHTQFPAFPFMEDYAPELFAYLVDNYEIDRVFTYDVFGYKLSGLRRSPRATEGELLFPDQAATALLERAGPGVRRLRVPPEERDLYLVAQNWPFRPTLGLRPSTAPQRTALHVALDVPERAEIHTAVGINPIFWFWYPSAWTRFEIAVLSDSGREVIFSRELHPQERLFDRGWFDAVVPLDAYAGSRLRLEFSTTCSRLDAENHLWGGWEEPRLVVRPDPALSGTPAGQLPSEPQ
jgi:hypothetical protein